MKKIFIIFILSFLTSILFPKTYEQVYTYRAIEADSRLSARTITYRNVGKLLLDEIISELEPEINLKKYSREQIRAFTSDFIDPIEIIEEDWNGESYYLKAQTELDIFDLKNEFYNLSKKNLQQLKDVQEKKERCFQEIEKIREKFVHSKPEEEIFKLSEIYKETISKNIYEFIPYIEGNGEAAVQIEQTDSINFFRKKVFLIAFCKSLLDIMQKVNIPLYESGVYKFLTEQEIEKNPMLYQTVVTKYYGNIKGFEIGSYLVNEMVEDNESNSRQDYSAAFMQMEYKKSVFVIRLSEDEGDELLYPVLFIDFPAIERIINVGEGHIIIDIGRLKIRRIFFQKEKNLLKCSLSSFIKN